MAEPKESTNDNYIQIDEEQFMDTMGFSEFGIYVLLYKGKIRNRTRNYSKVLNESKTGIVKAQLPLPPAHVSSDSESDHDDSKTEFEIYNPEDRIPCSNALNIDNGNKMVSAISIDSSGSRMLTGAHDFKMRMFDFATMDSKFKPFRTFNPLEDVPIRAIKHSPAGDLVMVYGTTSLIKILDRDGKLMSNCMRGDIYLCDLNKTAGHTAAVYSAAWNTIDLDRFVSSGADSTIRFWSVEQSDLTCGRVIRVKNKQSRNNPCVEVIWNPTGTILYGSCEDGSLNIWDPKKPTPTPVSSIQNAHQNGSTSYSLAIARNEYSLVSRGFDDTLKLYDLRNFKSSICEIELSNDFEATRAVFSPDYRLIMTGSSERRGKENCRLTFHRIEDLSIALTIPFKGGAPIIPYWHSRLNQLFVGCSDGTLAVFFDPNRSMKGVLMGMTRIFQDKFDEGENLIEEQVFNPYSRQDGLEMINVNVRKLQVKARKDPLLTRRPEPPVYGPGQGGRLTTSMSLSAFVCKQMLPLVQPIDDSDPREAILKYAQLAEEEPYYVAPAYEKTQPQPMYGEISPDEDEDDDIIKKRKTN